MGEYLIGCLVLVVVGFCVSDTDSRDLIKQDMQKDGWIYQRSDFCQCDHCMEYSEHYFFTKKFGTPNQPSYRTTSVCVECYRLPEHSPLS